MRDILQWASESGAARSPWLLLGKGPSFSLRKTLDTSGYRLCSLNHVVRELEVDAAHVIDIDVVLDCAQAIERNAGVLIMPHRPHRDFKPGPKTLAEYAQEVPVLRRLDREGRLVWYNLSSSAPAGSSPVIRTRFFSAEAALNVLAACGVTTARSLGIDGGASYSPSFRDLEGRTLLANGHPSFDRQFEGIARTIRETGIFYAPLHVEAPARVFVGTDASQRLACKVLEYSIKKRSGMSVAVSAIDDGGVPVPKDPAKRSRTGFSFSRFHIPALCGFSGRAVYMDADMQVFADLSRLWMTPFGAAPLLYCQAPPGSSRPPQYSVMLLDCARLPWRVEEIVRGLDEGAYGYEALMHGLCILPEGSKSAGLPWEWNSLERYEPGKTCLLHYTDMPTQPWVSDANPHRELWYADLREAVDEGFLSVEFLHEEVAKGHVSPDLPYWAGLPEPPGRRRLAGAWRPPFRRLVKRGRASLPFFLKAAFDRLRRWGAAPKG